MVNERSFMLAALIAVLFGLPIAASIDHATDFAADHRARPAETAYSRHDTGLMDDLLDQVKRENSHLLDAVVQVESGGKEDAVSPKGARGKAQVMPETARKPGFGVRPVRNRSAREHLRFAGEYLQAQIRCYRGNVTLGLMAYNWGKANVDRWLRAGADPRKIPDETKDYVFKVSAGLMKLQARDAEQFAEMEE